MAHPIRGLSVAAAAGHATPLPGCAFVRTATGLRYEKRAIAKRAQLHPEPSAATTGVWEKYSVACAALQEDGEMRRMPPLRWQTLGAAAGPRKRKVAVHLNLW